MRFYSIALASLLYGASMCNIYNYYNCPTSFINFNRRCHHNHSSKYTKKYFDNHQKDSHNRPYYGHRNKKYNIPKRNRRVYINKHKSYEQIFK